MNSSLTIIVLCLVNMCFAANLFGQKITISQKNITLRDALQEINKQTGYDFVWSTNKVKSNTQISINVKEAVLSDVLNKVLSGFPLQYSISSNVITIKERENDVSEQRLQNKNSMLQTRITGKVENEKGESLAGATVMHIPTGKSYTTDTNGTFILTEVKFNDEIEVTYVGYENKQFKIGKGNFYIIRLGLKQQKLEEVAVISTGFQTISKERSTGSYGVISKEQLEKPTTNISQRLVGTIAGLQARTLDENGTPNFEIRGQTSLLANATPLVVVDGFPIQGDFNSINPNDVESITVLKDAAAASVWGARSANGVIVITTKNGGRGAPTKVEFNTFTRIGGKLDLDYVRPLASSSETVEYEKLAYNNWRVLPDPISFFDVTMPYSLAGIAMNEAKYGYITDAEKDHRLEELKMLDNKKQISKYLLSNPASKQYNLSISGGTEKMSNFLSLMYEQNQSNFKETKNKKYQINFRNSSSLTNWLNMNITGMYLYSDIHTSGVTLEDIQSWSPYDMLINPDGSFADLHRYYTPILNREVPTTSFPYSDWTYNPIQEISNRKYTNENAQARIQGALNFKIMKGLSAEILGQYELGNNFARNLNRENTFFVRNTVNTATFWDQDSTPNTFILNLPKGNILDQNQDRWHSYNLRSQVNFNRIFGDRHEINILGGAELQNFVNQSIANPTAYGFNEETLGVGAFPNGPGGPFNPIVDWMGYTQTFQYVNSFKYGTQRLFSVYSNAGYTYNKKYTISGSYRFDASNLITDDPDYRYAPFYSFGALWHVHKEDFMKRLKWIDQFSARITYGQLGNYDPTTSFRPLISPSASPNIYINSFTAGFSSFGNPSLRWERTQNWDLGFDFSFLNRKLFGKLDIYQKHGKDLLATLSIPSVHGTGSQKLNNASMINKGIEIELGTRHSITKDLVWRGNINFAYNYNRIKDLFVVNYNAFQMSWGGTAAYVEGKNANTAWRWEYAGIENNQPTHYGPNRNKYVFGVTPQGNAKDFLLDMGTLVAPYTLGFTNSFSYKSLDFSFILTGKFGHVFQRLGFNYPATFDSRVLPNNKLEEVMKGDPAKIVPLPLNSEEPEYYSWATTASSMDYLIANANHIRLQEANLTYTFPSTVAKRIGLNRLLVFGQGNNLFTIYANKFKEDPEYPMGTIRPMPKLTFGIKFDL